MQLMTFHGIWGYSGYLWKTNGSASWFPVTLLEHNWQLGPSLQLRYPKEHKLVQPLGTSHHPPRCFLVETVALEPYHVSNCLIGPNISIFHLGKRCRLAINVCWICIYIYVIYEYIKCILLRVFTLQRHGKKIGTIWFKKETNCNHSIFKEQFPDLCAQKNKSKFKMQIKGLASHESSRDSLRS